MAFLPGSSEIQCDYCGEAKTVEVEASEIFETPISSGLEAAVSEATLEDTLAVTCDSCQATFSFDVDQHAGECPFCGHGIVKGTGPHRHIKPAAVLPFATSHAQARSDVKSWLQDLWFAPGQLRRLARTDGRLHGIYIPYWTIDSDVVANYRGQRGDIYFETQNVSVIVDGRRQVQKRAVQKIRWRTANGSVDRYFNDIMVVATNSLPDWMIERLGPWNLGDLKPYTPLFLQGFQAQSYNIALSDGYERAQGQIQSLIRANVRADIGGDLQKIHSMSLNHSNVKFKHILLPLWLGVYRYRDKVYHVSVNGQTGEVQGERPYSYTKIALAFLGACLFALLGAYLIQNAQF